LWCLSPLIVDKPGLLLRHYSIADFRQVVVGCDHRRSPYWHQLRCIDMGRIVDFRGSLSPAEAAQLRKALKQIFDF
jgi:hypothetical protein